MTQTDKGKAPREGIRHQKAEAWSCQGSGVSGVDASAEAPISETKAGHPPAPYEGPLGIEDDDDWIGGDIELKNAALEADEEMLPGILEEEEPYLGEDGMVGEMTYDLIDMREDAQEVAGLPHSHEEDAFTGSMDVFGEDLENYTEDIDEEIDSALS